MSNVWERFEGIASTDEVADARAQYAPIDAGTYVMKLEEIKPDESKDLLPMLKGRLRVEDTGKLVFYNQQFQNVNYPDMTAGNIAKAVEFVSGLLDEKIEFTTLGNLAKTVESIEVGGNYHVKVTYAKKDEERKFPILTIVDKIYDDTDLPFKA